ncbi:MAG: hypothetical protein GX644_07030 [Limnobacter sp.]|nr:hypothetical protein [Limnobacter sp.]
MTRPSAFVDPSALTVAIVVLAACSPTWAAPQGAASAARESATALRVERLEIVDRQGFEKPMVAATIMVPAGWQGSGEVLWNPGQRCGKAYAPTFRAVAPDGSSAIELSGQETWAATNYGMPVGECPQVHLPGAREYLDSWVRRHRANAQLIEYSPRPDKSRVLGESQSAGAGLRAWVDSGQALIGYRVDGREVFEMLATAVSFTHTRLAGGVGGQVLESLQGQALGVLSWRTHSAPVPQRHFDLVWDTLKPASEWAARIAAAERQMAAENAATQAQIGRIQAETSRETLQQMARRGQIINQTQQEIAQMRNEGWRSTQATQDRIHTGNVRSIREVHGYRDAHSGGVVELSNHYEHAWQLRDGSYVLTDDPDFDPARDFGLAGERLPRTRE